MLITAAVVDDGGIPLMEEILHHLGCIKSGKLLDIYHINWCRISSINSITNRCYWLTAVAAANDEFQLSWLGVTTTVRYWRHSRSTLSAREKNKQQVVCVLWALWCFSPMFHFQNRQGNALTQKTWKTGSKLNAQTNTLQPMKNKELHTNEWCPSHQHFVSQKTSIFLKLGSHAIPICGPCSPCGGPRGWCEFPQWCHLEDEVDNLGI